VSPLSWESRGPHIKEKKKKGDPQQNRLNIEKTKGEESDILQPCKHSIKTFEQGSIKRAEKKQECRRKKSRKKRTYSMNEARRGRGSKKKMSPTKAASARKEVGDNDE